MRYCKNCNSVLQPKKSCMYCAHLKNKAKRNQRDECINYYALHFTDTPLASLTSEMGRMSSSDCLETRRSPIRL